MKVIQKTDWLSLQGTGSFLLLLLLLSGATLRSYSFTRAADQFETRESLLQEVRDSGLVRE